jgi:hypothetical protein
VRPEFRRYILTMKQIWTSRMAQAAGKYGEHAPAATVCCNACRTCVTTNIVGLVTGAAVAAGATLSGVVKRLMGADIGAQGG